MSDDTAPPVSGGSQMRTLAVRISEDMRAQLDIIAQLTGRSTTEEIRLAIEDRIVKMKSDPSVLKKAEAVRADIEREAQTRRNAIAAIFSGDGTSGAKAPSTRSSGQSASKRTGSWRNGSGVSASVMIHCAEAPPLLGAHGFVPATPQPTISHGLGSSVHELVATQRRAGLLTGGFTLARRDAHSSPTHSWTTHRALARLPFAGSAR